ncbi:MAG: T9SS type A sorting domain-containing protein, partial [Rhodothermia bacterium]|nr:T9SS type A sorting domain-containing protein [Rhodothermia bacterium]
IRDGGGVGTFTPHRSPLGLVFDTESVLPGAFAGKGFVLSWTSPSDRLLSPFGDEGGDLLQLDLQQSGDNYEAVVERIVRGFSNPIDAVLVGDVMYVLEFGGSRRILEISFGQGTAVERPQRPEAVQVDVFPNPSSGDVSIFVASSKSAAARIEVFDVMGRRIPAPVRRVTNADGYSTFVWNASQTAAGIFVVRATVGNTVATRRLVIVD